MGTPEDGFKQGGCNIVSKDSSKLQYTVSVHNNKMVISLTAVADPVLELRRGGWFNLIALLAFLPSVISSFFTQNKGNRDPWAPPLDLPLNSMVSMVRW